MFTGLEDIAALTCELSWHVYETGKFVFGVLILAMMASMQRDGSLKTQGRYSYPENTTDPAAIIERIYLSLGHKQFDDHVFVYGRNKSRYDPLPIRDFDEYKMVHSLRQRAFDKPTWLVEYVGGGQSKIFLDERTQVMTAISKSFRTEILDQLVIGRDFRVYKIHVGSQDLAYLQ